MRRNAYIVVSIVLFALYPTAPICAEFASSPDSPWYPMCFFFDVNAVSSSEVNQAILKMKQEMRKCGVNLEIFPIGMQSGSYPNEPDRMNDLQRKVCNLPQTFSNPGTSIACVAQDDMADKMCGSKEVVRAGGNDDYPTYKLQYTKNVAGCAEVQAAGGGDTSWVTKNGRNGQGQSSGEHLSLARKGSVATSIVDLGQCNAQVLLHEAIGHAMIGHENANPGDPNYIYDGLGIGLRKPPTNKDQPSIPSSGPGGGGEEEQLTGGWTSNGCAAIRANAIKSPSPFRDNPSETVFFGNDPTNNPLNLESAGSLFSPPGKPPPGKHFSSQTGALGNSSDPKSIITEKWYPLCLFIEKGSPLQDPNSIVKNMVDEAGQCGVKLQVQVTYIDRASSSSQRETLSEYARKRCDELGYRERGASRASIAVLTSSQVAGGDSSEFGFNPGWGTIYRSQTDRVQHSVTQDGLSSVAILSPDNQSKEAISARLIGQGMLALPMGDGIGNGVGDWYEGQAGSGDPSNLSSQNLQSGWSRKGCQLMRDAAFPNTHHFAWHPDKEQYVAPQNKYTEYINIKKHIDTPVSSFLFNGGFHIESQSPDPGTSRNQTATAIPLPPTKSPSPAHPGIKNGQGKINGTDATSIVETQSGTGKKAGYTPNINSIGEENGKNNSTMDPYVGGNMGGSGLGPDTISSGSSSKNPGNKNFTDLPKIPNQQNVSSLSNSNSSGSGELPSSSAKPESPPSSKIDPGLGFDPNLWNSKIGTDESEDPQRDPSSTKGQPTENGAVRITKESKESKEEPSRMPGPISDRIYQ